MLYIIPDRSRIEDSLKKTKQYYAAFEYNDFCDPKVYTDPEKVEEIIQFYKGLDRETRMDIVHGAFLDITPHSQDPAVKKSSIERMEQSMSIAQKLGAKAVIFHTNTIPNFRNESYTRNWIRTTEQLVREFLGRYPGLEIYYENMFDTAPDDLTVLASRLRDEPRFGICLDYAHVQVFGGNDDSWIQKLEPYIKHIHVNDNDLKADLHDAVGSGKIDWKAYEQEVRNHVNGASVLIETHSMETLDKSVEYMEEEGLYPFPIYPNAQRTLTNDELLKIIKSCIDLTNEEDRNQLLARLLQAAMDITHCDAGTIYMKKGDALVFRVMKTISLGVDLGSNGEQINIPPVELKEENVCGYCAIHGELVNIADVYKNDKFNFEGPRKYDAITGYRTRSMIVIPIQNEKKAQVGVMQLMNAKDSNGNDRVFTSDDEFVLRAQASMSAVLILNMTYIEQIRRQMNSFVASFATAVDQRTPYNGSHTRKVAVYSKMLAEELNRRHALGLCDEYIDEDRISKLEMAAMLHDIGKMIIPLEVMNKETRLSSRLKDIEARFALLKALYERDYYKGDITEEEEKAKLEELKDALDTIHGANAEGFLPNEVFEKITAIANLSYKGNDGKEISYLTEEEVHCLNIRKGTLTPEERAVMENHVQMTRIILDQVYFSEEYAMVPGIAVAHHERLDGSGYPDRVTAKDLNVESRVLIVADIYDALTSKDRPYKKVMSRETAFRILYEMVDEGKLDGYLVDYLKDAVNGVTDDDIQTKIKEEELIWGSSSN